MSTSDAFLPAPEPSDRRDEAPDEVESELDIEEGLDDDQTDPLVNAPETHPEVEQTSFRTPAPGDHLTSEELDADMDDDSETTT